MRVESGVTPITPMKFKDGNWVKMDADAVARMWESAAKTEVPPSRSLPAQTVTVEHEGRQWSVSVSHFGTWVRNSCPQRSRASALVDIGENDMGIPQHLLTTISHLSNMHQNLSTVASGTRPIEVPFGEALKSAVNAFDILRSSFGGDYQMEYSEAAFRKLTQHGNLGASLAIKRNPKLINWINTEAGAVEIEKTQAYVEAFGEIFLGNFKEHGAEKAFEIAWRAAFE